MIIAFDLSGVYFNNGLQVAVEKISKKYDINPESVEYVLNGDFAKDYRTGMIESDKFWQKAKERLQINDINEVKKIFFNSYIPNINMRQYIKELVNKGFEVAYISNSPMDRAEYLDKKYKFVKDFTYGLFSFEANAWKPNMEIYKKFIEKYQLNPKIIVYIDDNEKCLLNARKIGINAVLFTTLDQLKADLVEMKIY